MSSIKQTREKKLYLDSNSTQLCPQVSNWRWDNIWPGNGSIPGRHRAIIWTNDDQVNRRIYATVGLSELTKTTSTYLFCCNLIVFIHAEKDNNGDAASFYMMGYMDIADLMSDYVQK